MAQDLIERPNPPTAMMFRGVESAGVAQTALQSANAGDSPLPQVEIVFQGIAAPGEIESCLTHVRPRLNQCNVASTAARMLSQMRQGLQAEPRTIVVPVDLYEADRKKC